MSIIVDVTSVHLWVEFLFKMQFEEYIGEKTPIFTLFLYIVHEALIKVPLFQETSPDRKILVACLLFDTTTTRYSSSIYSCTHWLPKTQSSYMLKLK